MEHVEQALGRALTSQETKQLQDYAQMLRQWNPKINLVSPTTLPDLEKRHIVDSAQLVPHLPAEGGLEVLDVGSGAGLPGIIMATLAPHHRFTLAERDQRKCAFLHMAAYTLGLKNLKVHAADVTKLENQYDVVTCRAWADMQAIFTLTSPLLKEHGTWLLLKGKALDAELKACETMFHLTEERFPSRVSDIDGGRGWVVKLTRG